MKSLGQFINARGCYLFGAGPASDEVFRFLRNNGVPVLGYSDNASEKWGGYRHDIPVISPSVLKQCLVPGDVICISCSHQRSVAIQLRGIGISDSIIYPYMSSMFSSYYDTEILQAHVADIKNLRSIAMDTDSKDYLDHLVSFRSDLNPFELHPNPKIVGIYDYQDLWSKLPEDPCILDVGAFTGDTARLFLERTHGRANIFAFEPLAQNFCGLKKFIIENNFKKHIHAENVLVGSLNNNQSALYETNSQTEDRRASAIRQLHESDCTFVKSITLDTYFTTHDAKKIDFIKMDIEGAELDALEGATELIQRDRPILAISGYHEPDHLWEIPHLIMNRFPFYNLAIGHDFRVHFEVEFYFFPN